MATVPTPFITVEQFFEFYDSRRVADFLLDAGANYDGSTPVKPTKTQMETEGNASNTRLRMAIRVSTDRIVAAAAVGKRYTRAELEALVAVVDSDGDDVTKYGSDAFLLFQITADLTFGELVKRRSLPGNTVEELAPAYAAAEAYLEQLRRGERIFASVDGVPEAGLPDSVSMTPSPGATPLWTQKASRFFGNCGGGCGPLPPYGGC